MVLTGSFVADDDELDIFRRHTRLCERHVLGDGVILAVAAAGRERFERRDPAVIDTPLHKVTRRYNRQIDFTIDHANACTAAARAALIDNGKETLCRQRTRGCVFAAMRQDLLVFTNFRLDGRPFAQNFSLGNVFGRESERLRPGRQGGSGRNLPRRDSRLALSVDILVQSGDRLPLRHLLRHGDSDPGKRQRH